MEESLNFIFDNNNLITHVIFTRDGRVQVKINGDDFYMYFDDIEKLTEYVKRNAMTLKEFELEVIVELKKYPLLNWKNKSTAKLVKHFFEDGLTVSEAVGLVILNN